MISLQSRKIADWLCKNQYTIIQVRWAASFTAIAQNLVNPICTFSQKSVCSCIFSQVSSLSLLYFLHLYPPLSHWQCRVEELGAMCAGLGQLQGFSSVLGCLVAAGTEHTDQPWVHMGQPCTPHISLHNEHTWEMQCVLLVWQIWYIKAKKKKMWSLGLDVTNAAIFPTRTQ